MTHRRAVAAMVFATLLWSIAGIVSRQLDRAGSFEATFWRSAFTAGALALLLGWLRGARELASTVRLGGATLWISGVCWAVMFTAFMVALTMTTVANVLVTMALAPLITAVVARVVLGHRPPIRTWLSIAAAGVGIGWMYAGEAAVAGSGEWFGIGVAFAVPVAAAANWTVIQRSAGVGDGQGDLLPAVLMGAVLSALATLPAAWPFAASRSDLGWLALLGVWQLAVPCLIAVAAARWLSAPEVALLALLEIVFGVLWTWLGGAETPRPSVLVGGSLVIGALVANEIWGMRPRTLRPAAMS